ncbi:hypothetical protein FCM35_KLT07078 [Carex littledalei]|uniref:Uncharacterized protein n=1 Tax=Carex littledalei TaxID=544730 RepID=A0A833QY86_9POAL|nr:hypothetical protein FCM35_KLT07078 [Carex littledalei]
MAPKLVFVALVSVLALLVAPIPSKVSATKPSPPMTTGPTNYTAIAIGGVVFCSSCEPPVYANSSPVEHAVVRVSCFDKNWKFISVTTTSGAGGFFYITWDDVASFDPNRCKAYIDWSPLSFCNVPLYWPGTNVANLYLVEVKPVPGGKQGTYSPGVLFLGPPNGTHCPPKH